MSAHTGGVSGKYPIRSLTWMGFSKTSKPATLTDPVVGAMNPVMIFIVVVLPAPLGPRKPTISPFLTEKLRFLTAVIAP